MGEVKDRVKGCRALPARILQMTVTASISKDCHAQTCTCLEVPHNAGQPKWHLSTMSLQYDDARHTRLAALLTGSP